MRLHQNAAIRALRNEHARLTESRKEAVECLDDPRIPMGVMKAQLQEIDLDMADLDEALNCLEAVAEMDLPTVQRIAV